MYVKICFLNKGYNYEVDSYSAFYNNGGFENTEMEEELDKKFGKIDLEKQKKFGKIEKIRKKEGEKKIADKKQLISILYKNT